MEDNLENIYYIHERMADTGILLVYKGALNGMVLDSLLANAKNQLSKMNVDLKIRKKIYSIMVECLENINRYNANQKEPETNQYHPLFIWGENETGFYIKCGNMIKSSDVPPLMERLEGMKNLNKTELKEKYRKTILKSKVNRGSGAGLGIIDMAIKSDNQMSYAFKSIDPNTSFFTLNINV
jgi:hypothetical protein